MSEVIKFWTSQSGVTDPGSAAAAAIDKLPSDIPSLHRAATEFVFHYWAGGDFGENKVPVERKREIHTRYASDLFDILMSRGGSEENKTELNRARSGSDRVVGCCRDCTVMFLALARAKGIPARMRVGSARYFRAGFYGFYSDHVIAEVWDASTAGGEGRWRLVDPQMATSNKLQVDGIDVDFLDLDPNRDFLNAAQGWRAARSGEVDPDKFGITPAITDPNLRGLPYLANNVMCDLAGLVKHEMLLWDAWGLGLEEELSEHRVAVLDEIAKTTKDTGSDLNLEEVKSLASREELRVPTVVTRFDPNGGPPFQVDVSRVLRPD